MKLLKIKTARFSQVMENCGKPQVYTLWQKPSVDRHLQAEIKKNRVMTILKSENGTDFGILGFKESEEARYLPGRGGVRPTRGAGGLAQRLHG